jgi:hypothetical protein
MQQRVSEACWVMRSVSHLVAAHKVAVTRQHRVRLDEVGALRSSGPLIATLDNKGVDMPLCKADVQFCGGLIFIHRGAEPALAVL